MPQVLDAVARSRDTRYLELLKSLVDVGTTEQRSAVAFRIRSYMEEDEADAFEFFKPLFTALICDPERDVREKATLSLEDWAGTHPQEVAQWCCHLVKAESESYGGPFTSMAGYHIRLAFSQLVAKHPAEAVAVLNCIREYPDKYDLNNIVSESKALPVEVREQARPILEHLLREGVPSAQDVLDSWDREASQNAE